MRWYPLQSLTQTQGGSGMGQIWVKTKNHPGAEKLWGGSLLSVLKKNSAGCTATAEMETVNVGDVQQKTKENPR